MRKEPLRADAMKELGKDKSGLDLKCDFPARETYRETLLERLLATESQRAARSASDQLDERDLEIRTLSDSELEMLAAAQGHPPVPSEWHPRPYE